VCQSATPHHADLDKHTRINAPSPKWHESGQVRDGVRDAFGVELEPEPVLVGVSL
jgi:hypothetical protein